MASLLPKKPQSAPGGYRDVPNERDDNDHSYDPRGPGGPDGITTDDDEAEMSPDSLHDVDVDVDLSQDVLDRAMERYNTRRRRFVALCCLTFAAAVGGGVTAVIMNVMAGGGWGRGGAKTTNMSSGSPKGGKGSNGTTAVAVGGGDTDPLDFPRKVNLPPIPKNFDSKCAADRIKSRRGRRKCKELCAPAECCFLPSTHILSCIDGNEDACAAYEKQCSFLDVEIPRAPSNLKQICSASSLQTDAGKIQCRDECAAAVCCSEPIEACQALDPDVCDEYLPCSALYGESVEQFEGSLFIPTPPYNLEDLCSAEAIASVDGFQACNDVCKLSLCCAEPIESCRVLNPGVCDYYHPCSALYGETVEEFKESIEVPRASPNLAKMCSHDSLSTVKGFQQCQKKCFMAECCRKDIGECRVLNPKVCEEYQAPCKALFRRDMDKDLGKVEIPPPPEGVNVAEVCKRVKDDVEAFTQCESLCNRARCCDGKIETCEVTNKETCADYNACQNFFQANLKDGTVGPFDEMSTQDLFHLSGQVLSACSYRSLSDPQGLARCQHLCESRFCCFANERSPNYCGNEYQCVVFASCQNLLDMYGS